MLWNWMVHYRTRKSLPNPVHSFPHLCFKVRFNAIHPSNLIFRWSLSFAEILSAFLSVTKTKTFSARFEVSTAPLLKFQVFLDVKMCRCVSNSRRFEGSYYFLPDRKRPSLMPQNIAPHLRKFVFLELTRT
jgi:hypothetical protein